jgi:protein-disulfide isomerase
VAKVQRKVVRKKQSGLSTGTVLVILGVALVAVVAIIAVVARPKPQQAATGDRQGLAMCGSALCPAKGDPNAPVTMIEVSDYACSHCREFNLKTEPTLEEQYIKTGKVRYISHVFGFQADTQAIAAAAMCANDQGKYWEYQRVLFQNQGRTDTASLIVFAQQVGLDKEALTACITAGKYRNLVADSSTAALNAGVEGTPSFFINGKLVSGNVPVAEFKTRIEAALNTK